MFNINWTAEVSSTREHCCIGHVLVAGPEHVQAAEGLKWCNGSHPNFATRAAGAENFWP